MGDTEDKIPVRRSSGKVEEMSADELEELNYERKVRDQESSGHLITPKQVNIFAAALCVIVMVYAIPRMFLFDNKQESTYIPLEERQTSTSYTDIYKAELQAIGLQTLKNQEASLEVSQNTNITQQPSVVQTEEQDSIVETITETADTPADDDVETPQPSTVSQASITQVPIISSVEQWASDWSAQNVETYLSHYSDKFISEKGLNISEWRAYRSARVTKPDWVRVQLSNMEIDVLSDSLAQVTFTQDYSASNYSENSAKRLSLELTDDGWKIISENSLN